jgi:hypothetical protein
MKERGNEFQLFLYLSQRIPARSAVEVSARSALTKGVQTEIDFVLIHPEGAVGHRRHAGRA